MLTDSFVLSAIGLVIAVGGGAIGHLYVLMFRMQERADVATASRFKEVTDLVLKLETRLNTNYDVITEARIQMVTKADLRDQIRDQTAQILREIDRRVEWTKVPGNGKLNA